MSLFSRIRSFLFPEPSPEQRLVGVREMISLLESNKQALVNVSDCPIFRVQRLIDDTAHQLITYRTEEYLLLQQIAVRQEQRKP